jgi:hypothetical protein
MHACIYINVSSYIDERPPHTRAHICANVCVCVWAHTHARRHMRAPSVGVDRGWFGPQAFASASRFNQNLAAWNVVRVTSLTGTFSSTAISGCNQNKLYAAWGTTLRAAYPTYVTATCVAISSFVPVNIQISSAATVTIQGVGFSSIDPSPSAYLFGQPCRTTTWTTATQLVCAAPSPVLATGAWRTTQQWRTRPFLAAARPPLGAAGAAREMWVKVAATTACEGFTFDGALPQ